MVILDDNTLLHLYPRHIEDLESSGLTKEQIALVGHFSADKQQTHNLINYDLEGLIFVYFNLDKKPYREGETHPNLY